MKSTTPSCSSKNRLARDTCRQALPAPRPPGGCRVPPGTQRLKFILAAGTGWRKVPHHQAHGVHQSPVVKPSPGGTTHAARCTRTRCPLFTHLSPSGFTSLPGAVSVQQRTPIWVLHSDFQGSQILALTVILTKCITSILIDLAGHQCTYAHLSTLIETFSLSRLP